MAQIDKPNLHFNTKLYTGNGSTQSITGVGFQPDWVWIKNRSRVENHILYDAVRGATKRINANLSDAEDTKGNGLTAFDSDGFSLGSAGQSNYNGDNIASWNWKANGAGSANTDGSINSTVSVNTTAGFSIVSYTGTGANATVGHGLGVAPKLIFIKNRDDAGGQSWSVYNKNIGNTKYLKLDTTSGEDTNATRFNSTDPTSTVFSLGTHGSGNASGEKIIAYCFAEKKGYSKFGKYTGNGNADGSFVYTGFKPAFTILKRTDATGGWIVVDNKRDTFNVVGKFLYPHDTGAEQDLTSSHTPLDFLSNGMKMRSSNLTGTTSLNISGATYIYITFAENPIVGSNNIPATAR